MIIRPHSDEHAPYFKTYIDQVPEGDLLQLMEQVNRQTTDLLGSLTEQQVLHRYAEGKWSVKEIIQHLIDGERVFQYRALRFSRADQTELSGYDHDKYVLESKADYRPMNQLLDEFQAVRQASIALAKTMDNDMMLRSGTANNNPISVRALLYVIVGHELHHVGVIKERYL